MTTQKKRAPTSTRRKILKDKDITTSSLQSKRAGKKKVGRPTSAKKAQEIDLLTLKQSVLLDNVEELVKEKHRAEMENIEGVKELIIPYTPSSHQQEVHGILESPNKRFGVVVVHRGWGKTWLAANELIRRAWACPAAQGGKFIYVAPEKLQAKKIVWRELKFFVKDLPHTANEAELTITFPNNSSVELAGADNPDRLRGQHPHFVVLDEVAQMPRDVWYEAIFPSLRANKGGALFIGTPKGDNLFKELFEHAGLAANKSWFAYKKTIFDTDVASKEEINELRATMPLPKFEQEYLCSFDAAIQGTYFGPIIDDSGRNIVGDVPWDPSAPVITAWDLGTTDSTVIWFVQRDKHDSKLLRVVDYYENSQKDIFHYINIVKSKKFTYDHHIMPHDVTQVSWETGRTRLDLLRQHGMTIRVAKKVGIKEGISMAQTLLYTCRFDDTLCKEGLSHLRQYRAKQDKRTGEYLDEPLHDAHSHAADAFRTLACGLKDSHGLDKHRNAYAVADYDYFNPAYSGRTNDNEKADDEYDIFNPVGI